MNLLNTLLLLLLVSLICLIGILVDKQKGIDNQNLLKNIDIICNK